MIESRYFSELQATHDSGVNAVVEKTLPHVRFGKVTTPSTIGVHSVSLKHVLKDGALFSQNRRHVSLVLQCEGFRA